MCCLLKFFKNLFSKGRNANVNITNNLVNDSARNYNSTDNQNNTNMINDSINNQVNVIITNNKVSCGSIDNLASLEKQKECCICMEPIDEKQLVCGHNIHILCILKSKKKMYCPLCSFNILPDCIEHIKKCKNINCVCKKKAEMTEIEKGIAHNIITEYIIHMNSQQRQIRKEDLISILRNNNVSNCETVVNLYT